jgi:hypothetical protein
MCNRIVRAPLRARRITGRTMRASRPATNLKIRRNGPHNHPGWRRRSISAPLLCDRYTLAARAIRWAIPWSRDTFPGLRAGVREILRRPTIAWATVQGWRAGRSSLPAEDAEMLAAYIRARAEPGIDLAKELENYAAKRRAEGRRARGFQVVRERDGTGSIPRDARWRGGRPRSKKQNA